MLFPDLTLHANKEVCKDKHGRQLLCWRWLYGAPVTGYQ